VLQMRKSRRLTEEHDDSTALQHAATNYTALQTAAHCRQSQWKRGEQELLQSHTAPDTVQHSKHSAMHCNTPQHTATHCNTLQHTAPDKPNGGGSSHNGGITGGALSHTDTHTDTHTPLQSRHTAPDNPLQHAATHCNTLPRAATHCNTLQQRHTVPGGGAPPPPSGGDVDPSSGKKRHAAHADDETDR